MEGFNSAEERGIIPRAIEQIFRHIQSSVSPRMRFLVRASYLQIYNEVISDLLKPERTNLLIREDKKKGVYVEGLSEWVVRSPAEIYGLMERGGTTRATASTKMNEISSRSHAVFIVIVEQVRRRLAALPLRAALLLMPVLSLSPSPPSLLHHLPPSPRRRTWTSTAAS
jgi:kinesin family protein 3/17